MTSDPWESAVHFSLGAQCILTAQQWASVRSAVRLPTASAAAPADPGEAEITIRFLHSLRVVILREIALFGIWPGKLQFVFFAKHYSTRPVFF